MLLILKGIITILLMSLLMLNVNLSFFFRDYALNFKRKYNSFNQLEVCIEFAIEPRDICC
jgi:hypothetical protein